MNLADVERVFWQSVRTDPGPQAQDVVFRDSPTLSARECVDIYRRMYWYRQVAALFDIFPITAKELGERTFAQRASAYIAQHPSTSPMLEHQGHAFAQFMSEHEPRTASIARVEWAQLRCLIAPHNASPLTINHLHKPDRMQVTLAPCAELVNIEPTTAALFGCAPCDNLFVLRDGYRVVTLAPDALSLRALKQLQASAQLSQVCALFESDTQLATANIGLWIRTEALWATEIDPC